jgi:hypothetical protein
MIKLANSATNLVVRRQFHCSNTVDVFFNFGKQVIPATDESTLVLIIDEI